MSAFRWFLLATLAFSTASGQEGARPEKDPHRPPCTSVECRKIRAFLKDRYCGASPFANGPDDGCDTRMPKKLSPGIKITADFGCQRDEISGMANCKQSGEPSVEVRSVLLSELHRLGLPQQAETEVHFLVWETRSKGLKLAAAYYEHVDGTDLTLCQLITVIDQNGRAMVVHEVPFQKTDADVPEVTRWSPIDLADVDGDGRIEVILEGDAYEDHWYEVHAIRDGFSKMIFSGLGYYL